MNSLHNCTAPCTDILLFIILMFYVMEKIPVIGTIVGVIIIVIGVYSLATSFGLQQVTVDDVYPVGIETSVLWINKINIYKYGKTTQCINLHSYFHMNLYVCITDTTDEQSQYFSCML